MSRINFRPGSHDDLPMLAEWLRDPQVAEGWPDPDHQLLSIAEDLKNPAMGQLIAILDGKATRIMTRLR